MDRPTRMVLPSQDRPRLLSDEPTGRRILVVLALVVGTLVLGHLVRYVYAAIYYDLLET
jgi:hypothetical protein